MSDVVRLINPQILCVVAAMVLCVMHKPVEAGCTGVVFPKTGSSQSLWTKKSPTALGLHANVVTNLKATVLSGRWALFRHGYLIHVQGSFNTNVEIKSARKTFHAATIGALIQKGKISDVDQTLATWAAGQTGGPDGCHARATLWHTMTHTTTFDEPTLCPGDLWAYSDANPPQLNRVAARAWRGTNSTDYTTNYTEVIGGALLWPIGATGWTTAVRSDGIRLYMDLEDMARFGVLLANRGKWKTTQVISESFVNALATKQTDGIPSNFQNENDGMFPWTEEDFPSGSPYGYMTWANTDQDLAPAAAATWAFAWGDGGHYVVFDRSSGVVLVMQSTNNNFSPVDPRGGPAAVSAVLKELQSQITGENPLVTCTP